MDKMQVDELLTCPICLDRFKQPKQLPCQHTFCSRPCLARLVKRDRIRCPECHLVHNLPYNGVDGLPNNIIAAKLLHLPIHKDSNIEAPCQDCKKNNVEARCHHCDKILCHVCLQNHSPMLSEELRSTVFSVRNIATKLSRRVADIDKFDQQIKKNAKDVKTEIRLWQQRCITDINNKTREFLNDTDAFVAGELRPFTSEQEELTAVAGVFNNFCSRAESEILQLERSDTSASSLSKHQKEAKELNKLGNQHAESEKNLNVGKRCTVTKVLEFERRQSQFIVDSVSSFYGVSAQTKEIPRTPRTAYDSQHSAYQFSTNQCVYLGVIYLVNCLTLNDIDCRVMS